MAAHESPRTTKLYDRTKEGVTQDEREYGFETAIGSFNYSFNFMLAGVPEPASTGLLTGLALLAAVGGFAVRDALRAAPSLVPLKNRGQFEGTRAS
jgi:hypothetical protein